MTLTTDHNRVSYMASGLTGVFPYTFLVLTAAELLVYVDDVLQPANAYTVSNLGVGSGGNVTLSAVPVAGSRVDLLRATDQTQQVNFQEGGKLPSEDLEDVLDKAYAVIQDVQEQVARSLKIPPSGATATTEPTVDLEALAGQVLKVNVAGTGLEGVTILPADVVTPITTQGDLIRGGTGGVAERLALGTVGDVLTVAGGQALWSPPATAGIPESLLQDKGDLIVASGPGVAVRKPTGSSGEILMSDDSTADGLNWVLGGGPHGHVHLRYDSATQLSLIPANGNTFYVKAASGWRLRGLSSAGLVAANTNTTVDGTPASNLAANTQYLVTVFDDGTGTLVIDFRSTLTHAPDLDFGVEVATGLESRTVVGRIRTNASSQFADAERTRFVLSWFQRRRLFGTGSYSTNRTTNSATFAEPNTEMRVEFLTWADEALVAGSAGSHAISLSGTTVTTGLALDGTTPSAVVTGQIKDVNSIGMTWMGYLAEGYHYLTLVGATAGGATATYHGADTAGTSGKCRVFVTVPG